MGDILSSTLSSFRRALKVPAQAPSTHVQVAALLVGAVGASIAAHRLLFARNKALREPDGVMVACGAESARMTTTPKQHVLLTGPPAESAAASGPGAGDVAPQPVIVLIHGFGCSSLEWGAVQAELSKTRRVLSYDRVLFADGPQREPRSARVLVAELDELIAGALGASAAATTPLLVVGHSYGGLLAQAFAMRFPGRVAGLVLVDPAHERQWEKLPTDFVAAFRAVPWVFSALRSLAPLGIVRAMSATGTMSFPPLYLFDSEARRRATELYSEAEVWGRVDAELRGCNIAFAEMPQQRREQPLAAHIPIRLLIAGDRRYSPTLHPAGVTRAFVDLHAELLQRPHARLVMAAHSDHWIHVQQPELVVAAAQELLAGRE